MTALLVSSVSAAMSSSALKTIMENGYGAYLVDPGVKIFELGDQTWETENIRFQDLKRHSKNCYIVLYGENAYNKSNPPSIQVDFIPKEVYQDAKKEDKILEFFKKKHQEGKFKNPIIKHKILEDAKKYNVIYVKFDTSQKGIYTFSKEDNSWSTDFRIRYLFQI